MVIAVMQQMGSIMGSSITAIINDVDPVTYIFSFILTFLAFSTISMGSCNDNHGYKVKCSYSLIKLFSHTYA